MRRSGLATTSGSAGTGPGNDTGVWLIMTIILFALLCNYSRTICLIDVGTEGITEQVKRKSRRRRSTKRNTAPEAQDVSRRPGGEAHPGRRRNSLRYVRERERPHHQCHIRSADPQGDPKDQRLRDSIKRSAECNGRAAARRLRFRELRLAFPAALAILGGRETRVPNAEHSGTGNDSACCQYRASGDDRLGRDLNRERGG